MPVTQLDSNGPDALYELSDAIYVALDGALVRFESQRACFKTVSTSALKSFCAGILQSPGWRKKADSPQQINAFYKSSYQHSGLRFVNRVYGQFVEEDDSTLSVQKVQVPNCHQDDQDDQG